MDEALGSRLLQTHLALVQQPFCPAIEPWEADKGQGCGRSGNSTRKIYRTTLYRVIFPLAFHCLESQKHPKRTPPTGGCSFLALFHCGGHLWGWQVNGKIIVQSKQLKHVKLIYPYMCFVYWELVVCKVGLPFFVFGTLIEHVQTTCMSGAKTWIGAFGRTIHGLQWGETMPWCQAEAHQIPAPQNHWYLFICHITQGYFLEDYGGPKMTFFNGHKKGLGPLFDSKIFTPRVYTKAFGRRIASMFPRLRVGVGPLRNPQDRLCYTFDVLFWYVQNPTTCFLFVNLDK
jgi:hypothetical protein